MTKDSKGIVQKSHLKSYKVRLTLLSPLFIGGGEGTVLNRTQYILDSDSDKIHILDERSWIDFLSQKGYFDDYLTFISELSERIGSSNGDVPSNEGGINEWLREKELSYAEYRDCIKYSVEVQDMENLNEVHCFIKDTDLKPFVPGSSIKGAMRTPVVCNIIRNSRDYYSRFWEAFERIDFWGKDRRIISREIDRILKEIERSALQTIEYPSGQIERHQAPKRDATNDIFKSLKIRDSLPVTAENLSVIKQKVLSTLKKKINELSLYMEYLKPGTEISFTLTIDHVLLGAGVSGRARNSENIRDFQSLARCLIRFSRFILDDDGVYEEFRSLPDFEMAAAPPLNNHLLLCLGGGTGFHTKTIIRALAPSKAEYLELTRKILDWNFKKHRHLNNDTVASPRAIKLVEYADRLHLPGWCSLELVEEIC